MTEVRPTLPETRTPVTEVKASVPELQASVPEIKATVPELQNPVPETNASVPRKKTSVSKSKSSVHKVKKASVPEVKDPVPEVTELKKETPETKAISLPPRKVIENQNQPAPKQAGLELPSLHSRPKVTIVPPAPEQLPEILCYWFPNLNDARQASATLGRPMLIHLYIDNCGPCNWMEHNVFNQAQIQKLAGSYFVMAKVNGKQYSDFCSRLGIHSFPTDVIISADGKYITHKTGRQEIPMYRDFLISAANLVNLPPMSKPVGPNWQRQLTTPPEQRQAAHPEMTAALEMPALDPPAQQENPSEQKIENQEDQGVSRHSSPEAPAAKKKEEPLPIASELDLMALNTKQEIRREDVPETSMDHVAAASEIPVMTMGESMNPRRNINPTSFTQEITPLLEGFSPVALVEEYKWVQGDENITAKFENGLYYFASVEEREKFLQNPSHYALVSSGCDIVILAESNQKVDGDRRYGMRYKERNFVFSSDENRQKFSANPRFYITKIQELAQQNGKPESVH